MDTSKGVAIGSAVVSAANVETNYCMAESNDDEWLIVSKRDSKSRLLPRRMIFVGRSDCDICVPSTTVDMRHAVLFFNGHHFHIKDLNSAYGTYVNDKRIAGQCYVRLQHSDRLRFGFGPDLFTIEKISSLPLTTNTVCDLQMNSSDIESVEETPQMEPQKSDEHKGIENLSKEVLIKPVSRLSCENHSNSSLSNSIDSLDEIKSIKLLKNSKVGYVSDKKEDYPQVNEEMTKEVANSIPPSTSAPDSLGSVDSYGLPTAFIITLDNDNENKKKMSIKDSIRKFAPPKPDSIEKQRPKSARNESIKCNENLFPNHKSPTNLSKRQTNALSANKTTKILNKVVNTPISAVDKTSTENGHLSDSATYLINRMLSNRMADKLIQTSNIKPNTVSSPPPKPTIGEKADSGLSDDIKSDSGNTYTVDENNEELEEARKKIDQVFGLDDSATVSLNSSPDSSLTLNSPTLLMSFDENLSKIRQSFGSPKFDRKLISSDSEVKPNSQLFVNNNTPTFTRTKRRVPTVEEMLHQIETKPSGDKSNNSSNYSNDLNRKQCNSSHINQFQLKNETQNNSNNIVNNQFRANVSHSAPSTPRSPLVSRKLVELRMNSKSNQKALNGNRRKNSWNSDLDYYESYNSDDSTDQSHRSSNSALSKEGGNASSASVPSKINFNRAFALRRARLGIETPGIDVTINKSPLNRNDGGRFSLRVGKKDLSDRSKNIGNRISSKEKLNNNKNSIQRKVSDPLGSMKSTPNKGQLSCVSDNERRNSLNSNRFNQLNNRLRHNFNQNNNNTNLSKNEMHSRQKTFTDSELTVSQKFKQNGSHAVQQTASHLKNLSHRRTGSGVSRDANMSSSLTEPSHKPPVSSFQTKNVPKSGLELTALDSLVVSAINQLSQKLKNNLIELIESQRLKHPTSSEARSMIDEILPQLSSPERRLNDNSVSVSRDLSAILKNLKKIEQSTEEPNATKTYKCGKQSNDFFIVDV